LVTAASSSEMWIRCFPMFRLYTLANAYGSSESPRRGREGEALPSPLLDLVERYNLPLGGEE
jgi:hypothetical protein